MYLHSFSGMWFREIWTWYWMWYTPQFVPLNRIVERPHTDSFYYMSRINTPRKTHHVGNVVMCLLEKGKVQYKYFHWNEFIPSKVVTNFFLHSIKSHLWKVLFLTYKQNCFFASEWLQGSYHLQTLFPITWQMYFTIIFNLLILFMTLYVCMFLFDWAAAYIIIIFWH